MVMTSWKRRGGILVVVGLLNLTILTFLNSTYSPRQDLTWTQEARIGSQSTPLILHWHWEGGEIPQQSSGNCSVSADRDLIARADIVIFRLENLDKVYWDF